MSTLTIRNFTDPTCPWAFSAEPSRYKLLWLFGDQLAWELRMVVLAEAAEEFVERDFTPEKLAKGLTQLQRRFGMPIDPAPRERMVVSVVSCRAVVAARVHAPEAEAALLRRLRILYMAGELIDEPGVVARAAAEAGVDAGALAAWMEEDEVERVLRADMKAARAPSHAAQALDHKLAGPDDERRYTCPSYEIERSDGVELDVPGYQPCAAYEVAIANLAPDLERRDPPADVEEVLAWAAEPLATVEIAAVCELEADEARERLARVAQELPVGADGYWTLTAQQRAA